MYIQNVPVYAGKTRECVSTCARGAGTHGDVVDGHTPHTTPQHNMTHHTTPQQPQQKPQKQLPTTHYPQHTTTREDIEREREREREEKEDRDRERDEKTEEKKTRQDKTRQDEEKKREEKKREDERQEKRREERRENEQDKRRDRMKKGEKMKEKRRDKMKKKRKRDRDERKKVLIFLKDVSRPSNPPDELAQNVFEKKKSPSDELFLHFSAKVQNLAVFELFTRLEFVFFLAQGIKSEGVSGGTVILKSSEGAGVVRICHRV